MATNQKERDVFTEDDILRALAGGPKRPSEIQKFLGLPDRQEIADASPRSWPWLVNLIGKSLQKMKTAGKVALINGRWQASDTETLTVQVPKIHATGLRDFGNVHADG
jgi:hypothetical protein